MSEQAPEAAPRRENVFTRRIGPLPMWVWLGLVIAVIAVYYLYKSRQSASSSTTDASQVPQFVNQVYTGPAPPSAPVPPPSPLPPPFLPHPGPPIVTPPGAAGSGLYFHSDPKSGKPYFSKGGQKISEPSGNVNIGGKTYYWHADKGYFTLNGRKVKAPASGPVSS